MSFCRWTKLLFTNFGLPKIFSGDKTLQIWLSELVWRARAGQGNLILSHPPSLFKVAFLNSGDSCETFSNPFFQKKKPSENESNCEVWLARAGLGAVALSSTAAPVLAPLSLKATPRPPYIWSTQPNFPLLGRQEAPRPKCVACHRCTQLHLDLPNPPSPAPRPA